MTTRPDVAEISQVAAPWSASFHGYWRLFHIGLPIMGAVAGYLSLPVWGASPFLAMFAWMVPELWPMRVRPMAVLKDRFDIPRAMFLNTFVYLFLVILVGFGLFHTIGAIILGVVSGGREGLALEAVLPVALLWSGLWLATRVLRGPLKRRNAAHLIEARRRRRAAEAAFVSSLRPELLAASANRRLI